MWKTLQRAKYQDENAEGPVGSERNESGPTL
jgi:hypothetical protein